VRRLLFATGNPHKVRELGEIVEPLGIEVVPSRSVDPDAPEVEETGETFEANAALKAIASFRRTGEWCIADDSGICVVALDHAPGIHSARWSGPACSSADNNRKLLAELDGVEDRRAYYVCALALVLPAEDIAAGTAAGTASDPEVRIHRRWPGLPDAAVLVTTRGRVDGVINHAPSGSGGFGYDPYFVVPELGRTFAEVSAEQKHAISHRGRAFGRLVGFLRGL